MSAVRTLPILRETKSNSELSTFLACQVRHFFSYGLRRKRRSTAEALDFGSLWHLGLQAWWRPNQAPEERYTSAVAAMATDNAMMLATLTELMLGYTARWSDAGYLAVANEVEFSMPLVNPDTGETHPTTGLMGIIDKVVIDAEGTSYVMEHKTTGSDIESGSSYWDRVRTLDAQAGTYVDGARALGFDVAHVIWDAVRKPTTKPIRATPQEDRKYTATKSKACPECKKKGAPPAPHTIDGFACDDGRVITDPGGKLYANQRDTDETPEEYGERLRADIAANPAKYYARAPIIRLEADELRHRRDTWSLVQQMRTGIRPVHNRFACSDFGGCEFREVCEGRASIDDESQFVTKTPRMQQIARGKGE